MKKRMLSLLLVMVMVLSLLPAPAMAAEMTEIKDQTGLATMSGGNYKLIADIQLDGSWTKIDSFTGTLDGNGHTITLQGTPVFNRIENSAKVSNLILEGSVESNDSVGSLAVINNGTVRNCASYAAVTYTGAASDDMSRFYAGGLIGYASNKTSTVQNCLYAGKFNHGNTGIYSSIINNGESIKGTISGCVGVGSDRIGTTVKLFGSEPIDTSGNTLVAEPAAFNPADHVDGLNNNRTEGDLEWTLVDGRLALKSAEVTEPEATKEELEALNDAITAAEAEDTTKVYTVNSWQAFAAALENARTVRDSGEKRQSKVTEATNQLTTAAADLDERVFDTVSSAGNVVEVNQGNIKDTLKNPQAGNYYKLIEDITIDDAYWGGQETLDAVLDGDGHTITLMGTPPLRNHWF